MRAHDSVAGHPNTHTQPSIRLVNFLLFRALSLTLCGIVSVCVCACHAALEPGPAGRSTVHLGNAGIVGQFYSSF